MYPKLLHLLGNTRIAAAIHNRYGNRILAYADDSQVAERITRRMNEENKLKTFVKTRQLITKSAIFQKMDGQSIPEFPEVDLISLRNPVGSYAIELCKSYYADHVAGDAGYEIQVGREQSFRPSEFEQCGIATRRPLLVRVKLQSRHSRSKIYQGFTLCDLDKSNTDSISGFYCQCLQGSLTVSHCAHIASVIWYLGHGRFQAEIRTPSKFLELNLPAEIVAESDDDDEV